MSGFESRHRDPKVRLIFANELKKGLAVQQNDTLHILLAEPDGTAGQTPREIFLKPLLLFLWNPDRPKRRAAPATNGQRHNSK